MATSTFPPAPFANIRPGDRLIDLDGNRHTVKNADTRTSVTVCTFTDSEKVAWIWRNGPSGWCIDALSRERR